jgi:hypothetical protein
VYFVTTKRPGYALFCMTPSERAAFGVTDDQKRVHLLERGAAGWRVHRDWPVEEHSHSEFLTRLGHCEEPGTIDDLLRLALGV